MNHDLIELISKSLNSIKGKCRHKDKNISGSLDISCSELNCMKQFVCRDRLSVKDLAERLGITSGGVTKVVGALEEQGILRRDMDPDDRRGIIVSLTPRGSVLISELIEKTEKYYSDMLKGLSVEELNRVVAGLKILNSAWEIDSGETGGENC